MGNIKMIIAVRHASYDEDGCGGGSISLQGIKETERLAEAIYNLLTDKKGVILLTSRMQRAKETAKIIGEKLGIVPTVSGVLHRQKYQDAQTNGVVMLLNNEIGEATQVIMVTHLEMPSGLINSFSQQMPVHIEYPCEETDYARGIVLNEKGNVIKIP